MTRPRWLEREPSGQQASDKGDDDALDDDVIDPMNWGLPYPAQPTPYVMQWMSRPIEQFGLNPYVAWRAVSFFLGGTDVTGPIATQLEDDGVMSLRLETFYSNNTDFEVILLHPSTSPEEVVRELSLTGYGRPDQFIVEMM